MGVSQGTQKSCMYAFEESLQSDMQNADLLKLL